MNAKCQLPQELKFNIKNYIAESCPYRLFKSYIHNLGFGEVPKLIILVFCPIQNSELKNVFKMNFDVSKM